MQVGPRSSAGWQLKSVPVLQGAVGAAASGRTTARCLPASQRLLIDCLEREGSKLVAIT
jgi:hypothetical protein